MPDLGKNFLIKHSDNQVNSEVDNELVLMNIEKGRYYVFDDVEIDVWRFIEVEIDFETLCERLAGEYNEQKSVIEADLREFLTELAEQDLIEIKPIDEARN